MGIQLFTSRQIILFCLLSTVRLFSDMVYSLQGPLFPKEAQSKNATGVEFGVVMGTYELASLVFSPIAGILASTLGISVTFNGSIFIIGSSTFLFGYLTYISTRGMFIALGCLLRIFEAAGAIGIFVTVNCLITVEFQESRSVVLGIMEGVTNVAFSIGPFIASALYNAGGFELPFNVVGVAVILTGIIVSLYLQITKHENSSETCTSTKYTLLSLLRFPTIIIIFGIVLIGGLNVGFLFSMLEIHLRQFHLTPIEVGLVFLLYGLSCAIGSPIFCFITNKLRTPEVVPLIGGVICVLSFFLLGPAPFYPLIQSVEGTLISVILLGIGISMTISTGFILALNEAIASGFKDAAEVSIKISTLWAGSLSMGLFMGPIVAGGLYDSHGLVNATLFPLFIDIAQVIFLTVFLICRKKLQRTLLTEQSPVHTNCVTY